MQAIENTSVQRIETSVGHLRSTVQPGKGRKCVAAQVVDDVSTQVEEDKLQAIENTSVQHIAASVGHLRSTILKILQKVYATIPINCLQCISSYQLIWIVNKLLRCGLFLELSSRMNGYETLCGQT